MIITNTYDYHKEVESLKKLISRIKNLNKETEGLNLKIAIKTVPGIKIEGVQPIQ